jgi:hypothetical protein
MKLEILFAEVINDQTTIKSTEECVPWNLTNTKWKRKELTPLTKAKWLHLTELFSDLLTSLTAVSKDGEFPA